MSRFPTYSSALSWLYARNQFAIKLGLDNTRGLLAALGNPEQGLDFLHVAGTNGKGSVCAALAAMLPALGVQRVGLYTSPHLVSFRERLRVDGEPVPVAWVAAWLNRHVDLLEARGSTYFEIVTAMAFCWFRERDCRAVVLETGLGGRLDATNVVSPRATAITSISLDHVAMLGDTLEAIQSEKLGIVKVGVPLVIDEPRTGLAARAEAVARGASASFLNAPERLEARMGGGWTLRGRFADYALPADLRTEDYQLRNAALAVLTLEAWRGEALPPEAAWMPALRAARMPGRMQRLDSPDHIPVLLDAAHNPAGAEALAAALSKTPGGARRRVFFSAMRDKDVPAVARALSGISGDLVFVNLSARYPRALSGDEARALLPTEGFPGLKVIRPEGGELEPLLRSGAGVEEAVFCGSLFLLGEVIPLLANFYGGLGEFAQMHREDEGPG
ncbi:MAG TPA: cyanophycin synthetase [Fibrobacteria bacterium]|nr:cyanophycin synthetase [Fibrobacteria bacterium]